MISVAEARAIALSHVRSTPPEKVALTDALGRTLAEPIVPRHRAKEALRQSVRQFGALQKADDSMIAKGVV